MVQYDHLANLLNHLVNNKKIRKYRCSFRPFNKLMISVLELMKQEGYIKEFKPINNVKGGEIEVEIGKLNFCKAIKPRFNVMKEGYDKYVKRYLPARNFGMIIVSTNKGLMSHEEAIKQNLGGKLIAYCY